MGAKADELKKLGISGDLLKAAEYTEDIYTKVYWAYQAYSIGKDVLTYLGFLEKPEGQLDRIEELLGAIGEKLDRVLEDVEETEMAVRAGSELRTRSAIIYEVIKAKGAANNTMGYLKFPEDEQVRNGYLEAQIASQNTANLLWGNEYLWKRIFDEDTLYSEGWSEKSLYPEVVRSDGTTKENLIWDYRLTIFAYMQVIAFTTIVYMAAGEAYKSTHFSEMQGYAEKLKEEYLKILNNFEAIRPPSIEEMKYVIATLNEANFRYFRKESAFHREDFKDDYDFIDPDDHRKVKIKHLTESEIEYLLNHRIPGGKWHKRITNYILGTVEKYSGYSCRTHYPLSELSAGLPLLGIGFDTYDANHNDFAEFWWVRWQGQVKIKDAKAFQEFYDRFWLKHKLRSWKQGKRLYQELGLPKIRETIKYLYQMLGMKLPAAITDYSVWSLRELHAIIPASLRNTQTADGPVSLRSLPGVLFPGFDRFNHSGIISLRQIFLLDEEYAPA